MLAGNQVNRQRHDRTEENDAQPEHHRIRAIDQRLGTDAGGCRRRTQSHVHKGKDREKFRRFRPQSRTATPEHFVCRNLSRDHHQFDGTDGRGHTGHDPQQRNQSGVPERDTNGLRKQKARVDRNNDTQCHRDVVKEVAQHEVFAALEHTGQRQSVKHCCAALQREQHHADHHPAAEVEAAARERVERRCRQIREASQVTHHQQRTEDARYGAQVHKRLFAHPAVEEHPHAGQADEPKEECNRPTPIRGLKLHREICEFHHFCTTTKKLGFVP